MIISRLPKGSAGGSAEPSFVLDLTLEGAVGDEIDILDSSGISILGGDKIYFEAGQSSSDVSIFVPEEGEYTFVSYIAKALDNSGDNYAKKITLSQSTDVVKVYDDSIFWAGNTFGNGKSIWQSGVTNTTKKVMSVVGNNLKLEYTHLVECQYTTENAIDLTNYSKLTAISSDNQKLEVDISNVSGNYNICFYSAANTGVSGRNIIFMYVIKTLQTPYQQAVSSATTGWGTNWTAVRAIVLS